jgi:hypothetical protein
MSAPTVLVVFEVVEVETGVVVTTLSVRSSVAAACERGILQLLDTERYFLRQRPREE